MYKLLNNSKKLFHYSREPGESLEFNCKSLKAKIIKIIEGKPSYGCRRIKNITR